MDQQPNVYENIDSKETEKYDIKVDQLTSYFPQNINGKETEKALKSNDAIKDMVDYITKRINQCVKKNMDYCLFTFLYKKDTITIKRVIIDELLTKFEDVGCVQKMKQSYSYEVVKIDNKVLNDNKIYIIALSKAVADNFDNYSFGNSEIEDIERHYDESESGNESE